MKRTLEMKRYLPVCLDILHALSLAMWLGGLVAIGALVAPAAFHVPGLTRVQSGLVVGESLRRLGGLIEPAGVAMIAVQWLARRRFARTRALFLGDGVRQFLTLGALFLAETCRHSLFPAMDAARAANRMADFDRLHHVYSSLAMAQVWLLVAVSALTIWLTSPHPQPGSSPAQPAVRTAPAKAPLSRRKN